MNQKPIEVCNHSMAPDVTQAMARALELNKLEDNQEDKANPKQQGLLPSPVEAKDADDEDSLSSPATNTIMDPSLWIHLPEHLMDQILTHLSISSLFRCRSVCKAWHTLALSPTFVDFYARTSTSRPWHQQRHKPWFYMFRNQDYRETSTFIPTRNQWVNLTLPALTTANQHLFFPIASAGGLLCFSSCANGRTMLAVANPITAQWRELPPMLRIQTYHMAGMVVDRHTKSYKIVVVGIYGIYDVYYPTTEVFTSENNSWTISGDIPRGPLFPSRRTLLSDDGVLYSWCCDPPDGLVAYHMERGTWSQIHAPMRHSLDSHILLECQGRIYTVGGLRESSVTRCICVWELQQQKEEEEGEEELEWKEVDRMPDSLYEEFLCGGGKRFVCIGADGLVLLIVRGRDQLALLYNLRRKLWQRLPACPLTDQCLRYGLIDGIAFKPTLDATV